MARPHRSQIERELDRLASIISHRPEGIGREALQELAAAEGEPITKRSILRRLEQLAMAGRIRVLGAGRATKYAPPTGVPTIEADADVAPPDRIPRSAEGMRLRRLVRRPISARRPVGYEPDFLDRYEPGVTWYLPPDIRGRLRELGATPEAGRPAGTYARDIYNRLLIDLAWASSRLEGNTYSRLDTQNLIEFGQRAAGKDAAEAQMILNHKGAIELLVDGAEQVAFDRYTVLSLHAALSENLLPNAGQEGRLRQTPVSITGSTYVPLAIPQRIEEYFYRYLRAAAAIPDPFEQAFFTMVHVPYLQPFVDINKRTSRLAANIPFIKQNLAPLSFIDVPERAYIEGLLAVYELQRIELLRDVFVWAYERSCEQYTVVRDSLGDPDPFRMRYRQLLAEAVRDTVISLAPPREEQLRAWADRHGVPSPDQEQFGTTALALLLGLHEFSAARYRVRPSEYRAWRDRFAT